MKYFFIIILSVVHFSLSAQYKVIQADIRLSEIYPQEKLDYLVNNYPNEVAFLNFKLDNSYELVKVDDISEKNIEFKEIKIDNINHFNFLSSGIIPLTSQQSYYRIVDTELVMVVRSIEQVKILFKQNSIKK
jgi:hypothetical protein